MKLSYYGETNQGFNDQRISNNPDVNPDERNQLLASSQQKKWYYARWVRILTFFVFPPMWAIFVFDDPDSSKTLKIIAVVWVTLFMLFIFMPFVCRPLMEAQYFCF